MGAQCAMASSEVIPPPTGKVSSTASAPARRYEYVFFYFILIEIINSGPTCHREERRLPCHTWQHVDPFSHIVLPRVLACEFGSCLTSSHSTPLNSTHSAQLGIQALPQAGRPLLVRARDKDNPERRLSAQHLGHGLEKTFRKLEKVLRGEEEREGDHLVLLDQIGRVGGGVDIGVLTAA